MNYKLYAKNGLLILENEEGLCSAGLSSEVAVFLEDAGSLKWRFSGFKLGFPAPDLIAEANLLDEEGSAFSDLSFWLEENLNPEKIEVLGNKEESAASSDSGSFSIVALFKRLLQGVTSLISSVNKTKKFEELQWQVLSGQTPGRVFLKSGRNPNVTSSSAPEDMWNGSSVYTGFPSTADEFQIVCSAGDVGGSVTLVYLASSTSKNYQTATFTLSSTVTNTGLQGIRCHTFSFNTANGQGFNVGEIILRHRNDNAVVFGRMPIGRSQSYISAATVPYDNIGYLWELFAEVYGTSNVSAEMVLYVDEVNASPRLRRNMVVNNTTPYQDSALGKSPLTFNASAGMIDISLRILTTSSASANTFVGGFNLMVIPN